MMDYCEQQVTLTEGISLLLGSNPLFCANRNTVYYCHCCLAFLPLILSLIAALSPNPTFSCFLCPPSPSHTLKEELEACFTLTKGKQNVNRLQKEDINPHDKGSLCTSVCVCVCFLREQEMKEKRGVQRQRKERGEGACMARQVLYIPMPLSEEPL